MRKAESLEQLIAGWDGVGVVSRFDGESGAWFFVAMHDDSLGRPTGGTRLRRYGSPAEGLLDAMRLAEGMTAKWAVAGVKAGGGKAVLAVPGPLEGEARRGMLRRYGGLVESLRGAFSTGEDLGTTPQDMADIASATRWVLGGRGETVTDPGPFTARGVVGAIRASARHAGLLGGADGDLSGLRVLIQGVGHVGGPLARELAAVGAELVVSDVNRQQLEALAEEIGATTVAPDEVYGTACDIFAPCAIGAVISPQTVPHLACRAVVGSANNQLASDADAGALHDRGILYAPDYVANAGGAIAFAHLAANPNVEDGELFERVGKVETILDEVFTEAAERAESPLVTAQHRVERILADARPG